MKKLIQASTLNALMLGNFDRTVSVREFLRSADTGIGTYTGLDGEAIFEDGVAYRASADGTVSVMQPDDGVAFGTVAAFGSDLPVHSLGDCASLDALRAALEPFVAENRNIFYVLKASGDFSAMHVRSCFPSRKPYPTLSAVAENQREFRYSGVQGSLIAIYCPRFVNGINLPGWHFHFLSGDKTKGGHVLGLSAGALRFQLLPLREFDLILPENAEFAQRDLCEDLSARTAAVEGK